MRFVEVRGPTGATEGAVRGLRGGAQSGLRKGVAS